MLKFLLLSVSLLGIAATATAQNLPVPPDIAAAYRKGTRATDGRPGKNYWQNHGHYTISLTITPPNRVVRGVEQITYFNNSPDILHRLNMKLIMNMHRQGRNDGPESGIQIDDIRANGVKVAWDNAAATQTNQMIGLDTPLKPRDSVKLDIAWHFRLSLENGREGVIDPTTFYLAYFYPRVAVYDDYQGWDTQPHNGMLEFYNDFNNYTLHVTVPANYIVWATGELQNPEKVLQTEFVKRLKESMTSDSTVHIATAQDLADKNITAKKPMNTWTWTASHITDMAVGLSDHYNWDAASVVVDEASGRRAGVQAAYPDTSQDFHRSVQFGRYSLHWFSRNWPGVPYPFPKMTAFQGFADMEYPMMVNDSPTNDPGFAQMVQDHEIAHTYFPFYMGINESRYAFMDEGWATMLELLIGSDEKGKKAAEDFYKLFRISRWTKGPHTQEMPIITPSPEVTYGAGNNAYGKPSLSYLALKDMLGDKLFKKALHKYMENWHGRHPIPWDYFYSMSNGSGEKLDWFFSNWFFTSSYIDIDLAGVDKTPGGYSLTIRNTGGFAIPFDVNVVYADDSTNTLHQTPVVWKNNQKEIVVKIRSKKEVKSVTLEGGIFMDADMGNNVWLAKEHR
jgi:hypothetical protein